MPVNNITTPRIVVSPRATTLATYLLPLPRQGTVEVHVEAGEVERSTGLTEDSVRRAVRELRDLGAITGNATSLVSGLRYLQVNAGHWVFVAVSTLPVAGA